MHEASDALKKRRILPAAPLPAPEARAAPRRDKPMRPVARTRLTRLPPRRNSADCPRCPQIVLLAVSRWRKISHSPLHFK
eukprot:1639845-Pleurochrysis_carterae.AAC.3